METQRCLKCKKIEYALKNNPTIEQIQELFNEQVELKVINKSYDSIPHLSGSRLGASDSHIDIKQEKLLTEKFPPVDCMLYIEEKMDGSNCAVIRKNGEIIAVGRSGYRCANSNYEQHRRFAAYVEKRKDMFEKLLPNEDDRVVGEWLAQAHGTMYKGITEPYQVFDYFRGKERLNYEERKQLFYTNGLTMVPLLYSGKEPKRIEEALFLAISKSKELDAEGVVYRLELWDKKKNKYIPFLIAKVVRQEKEDGKYLSEEKPLWLWQE